MSQPYHAFTTKYSGITNRIITPVQVAPAFDLKNPPPHPKFYPTSALWDTGATQSVVTENTVKTLGLVPVGKSLVHYGKGHSHANTYLVNLVLPNSVGFEGVLVSECDDPVNNQFGVIIGMDIIASGDLSITNCNGQTWLTYRYPSVQTADFVADTKKLPAAAVSGKIGRNEKCPCGSGKKYKKCHGAAA
jgi:SEC-C motif